MNAGRKKGVNGKMTDTAKAVILEHLAKTWDKVEAARLGGVSYETLRYHINKGEEFAAATEVAYRTFVQSLRNEVVRRGRDGVKKGVYYKGRRVDEETVHSDGLLLAATKRHDKAYVETQKVEQKTEHTGTVTTLDATLANLSPEGRKQLRELLKAEAARNAGK